MAIIQKLIAVLGLDPREFDKRLKEAEKSLTKTAAKMQDAGRSLTVGVTAPIVGIGAVAVKSFASFDSAMTKSTAIMGDVTDRMDELQEAALEVGRKTTFGAAEAAEAFFFLASAGLNVDQSISSLPQVAEFAQAGMFDLALATDLLTDAQSALGLTVDDTAENFENMARVSDVLVKANTIANATVKQFSESLTNQAAAAARNVGIELEEVVAVLAAFADQGIKGAEAGTKFAIVVRDLSTKAAINAEAFRKMGIRVFDADKNLRPLSKIIRDLERGLGTASVETQKLSLKMLGFADRSVGALQSLLGFSGQIEKYERQLKSASGITEEIAQNQLKSFVAQMKLVKNSVTEVFIALGAELVPIFKEELLPIVIDAIKMFADAVKAFKAMDDSVKKVVVGIVALAAALGPALIAFGGMIKVLTALAALLLSPAIGLILVGGGLILGLVALGKHLFISASAAAELDGKMVGASTAMQRAADAGRDLVEQLRVDKIVAGGLAIDLMTRQLEALHDNVRANSGVMKMSELIAAKERAKALTVAIKAAQDALQDLASGPTKSLDSGLSGDEKVVPEGGGAGQFSDLLAGLKKLGETGVQTFDMIKNVGVEAWRVIDTTIDAVVVTNSERLANFFATIAEKQEAFRMQANEAWTDWLAVSLDVVSNIKLATLDFFASFSAGFGDAIAQIVVFQEDFEEVMKKFLKNLLGQVVSTLTQIVVNWLIATIAQAVIGTAIHTQRVGQALQLIYLNSVAAFSAIPIVGPIIAPALAAGVTTVAAGASIAAAAAGGAVGAAGSAPLGLDTGGLILGDGMAKLHAGERVLRKEEVRSTMGVGGGGMMMVTVELDGQVLTQKILERIPHELRARGL